MGRLQDAAGEIRQGMVNAANKLRPKGIAAGAAVEAPAAPAAAPTPAAATAPNYDVPTYQRQGIKYGGGGSFPFDGNKYTVGRDGYLKPNAPINHNVAMEPPPNMAGPRQSVASPQAPKPGIGGTALSALGTAAYGYGAYENAKSGDVGNAVGDAAMAAAPWLGAPGRIAMGADLLSRGLTGKSVTDNIGAGIAKVFGPGENSMLTPEFQKQVDAAGGAEKYIAGLRGTAAPAVAPAAAPAVAQPAVPGTQSFAPGSAEAATIRQQVGIPTGRRTIDADGLTHYDMKAGTGNYMPAPGEGLIVNNSTGRAIRINSQQPAQAAPAEVKPANTRDLLLRQIADAEAAHRQIGNRATRAALNDLTGKLATYDASMETNRINGITAQANLAKTARDGVKERNADERANMESIDKHLSTMILGTDGKPDATGIADFKERAQSTVNKQVDIAKRILNSKDADDAAKQQAVLTLQNLADENNNALPFSQLGSPVMNELLQLDKTRRLVRDNSTFGKRAAASVLGGAAAGAAAGKKVAGIRGAVVGGVLGGVGGGAFAGHNTPDYVEDDNLMNYRFEANKDNPDWFTSPNGSRVHKQDLSTASGHNWILPKLMDTVDRRRIDNNNVVVRK